MRLMILCAMVWCLPAQESVHINYQSEQTSVQDAARAIATPGLPYDWQRSHDQTGPTCRQSLHHVQISDATLETAMHQILDPFGLRYEIENGAIVLHRREGPVSYRTAQMSVQDIARDLARQAGYIYDWEKSYSQTEPACRKWVYGLTIKKQPFDKAMTRLLKPFGLRYAIESGTVVLYRK